MMWWWVMASLGWVMVLKRGNKEMIELKEGQPMFQGHEKGFPSFANFAGVA